MIILTQYDGKKHCNFCGRKLRANRQSSVKSKKIPWCLYCGVGINASLDDFIGAKGVSALSFIVRAAVKHNNRRALLYLKGSKNEKSW